MLINTNPNGNDAYDGDYGDSDPTVPPFKCSWCGEYADALTKVEDLGVCQKCYDRNVVLFTCEEGR